MATIGVGGKPETAVSDNAGHIFVNVEDKNEIVKIDAVNLKVLAHWSILPVEEPTGLAIDLNNKRLFAAGDEKMVVINYENGQIITTLPIGEGCDGLVYDKNKKLIFTSNGSGTLSVIRQSDANKYVLLETVSTQKSARTIALDENTGLVYLPAAQFEAPVVGAANKRTPMVPGTFKVIVVGKK